MNQREIDRVAADLGVEPDLVRQMEGRLAAIDEAFDGAPDMSEDFAAPARYLEDAGADPASIAEIERGDCRVGLERLGEGRGASGLDAIHCVRTMPSLGESERRRAWQEEGRRAAAR